MAGRFNPLSGIKKYNAWLDKQHWLVQIVAMLLLVFVIRTFVFGLYWVPTGSMEPTMLVGESFFADKFTVLFTPIKQGNIISFNDPTYNYSSNPLMRFFQNYVYGPVNWTKRVIGVPGDRVQGKIEQGRPVIYVNGKKLDQPFVNSYPLVAFQETSHQLAIGGNAIPFLPLFSTQVKSCFKAFDPALPITDPCQPFYRIKMEEILPHERSPLILLPNTQAFHCGVNDVFDVVLGEDEYFGMGDNRQGSFDSRGFGRINRSLIHGRIIFRIFSIDSPNSLIYELLVNPFSLFNKFRSWKRWFCWVH